MRKLTNEELVHVYGAGGEGCSPTPPSCDYPSKSRKGNNGFGNGPDANLAAPGNSRGTPGNKDFSPVR